MELTFCCAESSTAIPKPIRICPPTSIRHSPRFVASAAMTLPTTMTEVQHSVMMLGPHQSSSMPPTMGKTVLTKASALLMTPNCVFVMSSSSRRVFFSGDRLACVHVCPIGRATMQAKAMYLYFKGICSETWSRFVSPSGASCGSERASWSLSAFERTTTAASSPGDVAFSEAMFWFSSVDHQQPCSNADRMDGVGSFYTCPPPTGIKLGKKAGLVP